MLPPQEHQWQAGIGFQQLDPAFLVVEPLTESLIAQSNAIPGLSGVPGRVMGNEVFISDRGGTQGGQSFLLNR